MNTYPILNNDPELLKKTKDDELKNMEHKTEKHDHENILKPFKIDKEYYGKYKSLKKESTTNYH